MADHSDAPVLTKETIRTLIARLGGQLDKVEGSGASPEDKEKVSKLVVSLMDHLKEALDDDVDRGLWLDAVVIKFSQLAALLRSTLDLAAEQLGRCYYRRDDGGALVFVCTTADACEGIGQFEPNTCPP